jgi:hypothetical protein
MAEKDNAKWLERSTIGSPRYISILYFILVGFGIIGKYEVSEGYELFRDILTIILAVLGLSIAILGYLIYAFILHSAKEKVEKWEADFQDKIEKEHQDFQDKIEKEHQDFQDKIEKEHQDFSKYSTSMLYLNIGTSVWMEYVLEKKYLFSWDNVPGNDNERLVRFLRDELAIGWAENVKILKSDDGKTIRIFNKKSAEIIIDEKKEKATLKITDGRTHDLNVKKENGKLNIYEKNSKKLEYAISITRQAYMNVQTLDEENKLYERLICETMNNLGYYLAERKLDSDREFANQCAEFIKKKFRNYPECSTNWQDTCDFIKVRYGD